MADLTAKDIAPRLYRALEAERVYQRRKALQRRYGIMTSDVMAEEMIRAMRLLNRLTAAQMEAMVTAMRATTRAVAAMRDLGSAWEGEPDPERGDVGRRAP